jgi:predicted Zn-dependent peptidase
MMGVTVQTTRDAVPEALSLLADAILEPTFDGEDVELERRIIQAEMQLVKDDPAEQVEEAILRAAWGEHPLARPILGTESTLAQLTPDVLRQHHQTLVQPGKILVAVVGDYVKALPDEVLSRLPIEQRAERLSMAPLPWSGRQIWETRSITDQVHVRLAFEGLASSDPDLTTLSVLNRVLGVGASSRLFQRLREDEGLTYDVWSTPATRSIGGLLEVGWTCPPGAFTEAWQVVGEELRVLAEEGVSETEVEIAKQGLERLLIMDAEHTDSLCALEVSEFLERGRSFELERSLSEIRDVTPTRVSHLAERLLRSDKMATAIAAPDGFVEQVA